MNPLRRSAILALFIFALSVMTVRVRAAEPPTKPDEAGFRDTVAPFFAAHCIKCHGEKKQEGKLSLHAIPSNLLAGMNLDSWHDVADRLKAGEMPPVGEKQPDPVAIMKVTDWIDAEMAKAGKSGVVQVGSLKSGNHVPHDLLFGPKATAALEAPPRLWRISPAIYAQMISEISKRQKLPQPFGLPAGEGFKDQATGGTIDEATASQLIRNADLLVTEQLGQSAAKLANKKPLPEFAPLMDEARAATPAQIEVAIRKQFEIVLRRKPTDAEIKRFVAFHEANVKLGGAAAGAKATLMAVLLMPEVYYRSELGGGPADLTGRRILAPRELAFAIAYALTDKSPDADLLKAADTGKLVTKADVGREANRLLNDAKLDKPRLLRFFREYFGYGDAANVFKDVQAFQGHNPRAEIEDTDQLVRYVLDKDKDVFRELLTTTKTFVSIVGIDAVRKRHAEAIKAFEDQKAANPAKVQGKLPPNDPSRIAAGAYNLTDFPAGTAQPVDLAAKERAGILTQPSWLVAHSDNSDNHAIRRGKWVRERLLGLTVPDLPITVDAQLPIAPHQTLRERMEVTKQTYCWQCHQKMNPLGLAFETFDHFGRYRKTEQVEEARAKPDSKAKPVFKQVPYNSAAKVEGTRDPAVDGDYPDAVTMIRKLANADRTRQVFVRHAFRYWLGREETVGDAASLRSIDKAYLDAGGSFKALVVAILTSDAFLYRTTK